jgi:hypothetical protein
VWEGDAVILESLFAALGRKLARLYVLNVQPTEEDEETEIHNSDE